MHRLLPRRLPGWLTGLCLVLGLLAAPTTCAQTTAPPADLDFTPIETLAPARAHPATGAAAGARAATRPVAAAKPAHPTPSAPPQSRWLTFVAGVLGASRQCSCRAFSRCCP